MSQLQVINTAQFSALSGSSNVLAGGDNTGLLGKVTIGSNLTLVSGVLSAIGGGSGSVTSVGLTAPSAFNVSGSPITTSGTLALTAAGNASQYIRGDGTLADLPTSGGGGSAVSYYLNGSVSQGTIGGVVYKQLSKVPVIGTGTNFSVSANGLIASFITDAGDPSLLSIPGGNWSTAFYFSSSSTGGNPSFYSEVYKYDGTTFTLLGTSVATPEVITNGTSIDIYYTNVAIASASLTVTDRIAIKVYVTTSGRTITLYTESNHLSQLSTTFATGLTALNGLSAQVQYFATGTTGSNFNISSTGSTHTFNIPTANNANRGLLLAADWISFDAKQNSLGTGTTSQYLRGDLTWQTPVFTTSLSALTDVSLTALSNGQYLRYQAGSWINATPTWVTSNLYTADGTLTSNRTISSGGYTLGIAPKTTFNASITAASALAQGSIFSPTLLAAANNDILVGVDISPTFTNGSFTGVSNIALRVVGSVNATSFIKTSGTSSQFLKADGSVDSSVYITRSGISASSPIVYSSTTGIISIPVATLTVSGYLNNSDWGAFNAKQNSLGTGTTSQFLRGDLTWQTVPYPTALSQLSDVTITTPANGQLLRYTAGGWINFTPTYVAAGFFSATAPLTYNSSTGVFAMAAATTTVDGYLTAANFTTFNGKQAALNGTGFIKATGTTISYDNSTYLTTTSAASTYLPLAGGTLTGALSGTSATFITNSNSTIVNSFQNTNTTNTNSRNMLNVTAGNVTLQFTAIHGDNVYISPSTAVSTYLGYNNTVQIASTGAATFSGLITGTNSIYQSNASGQIASNNWSVYNGGATDMNFAYNASGTFTVQNGTNRFQVASTGNVLIGFTTDSGYKLDVNGTARIVGTTSIVLTTTNTSALAVTQYSITGANAQSLLDLAGTWNTTGNPTAIKLNITNTASGASSNLMDLQVGAVSKFKVDKAGLVTGASFYESSDKRQKTLIEDNFQAKGIENITPKLYTKNDKVELGYYAQDVQGILDGAVSEDEKGMFSLSYREVHTAKIYALELEIKELKELIKSIIDGNRN